MSEREYYRRRDRRQAIDMDLDERTDLSESIVKTYPSISFATESHLPIYAFDKYGEPLAKALSDAGFDKAMCFFEFWGPSSFAGHHNLEEQQTVTLFDIAPFAQGILEPERFLKIAEGMDHAKLLYTGECTAEFIESVRASTLPGMTFEGVVCKAKNDKKTKMPIMFKQKSRAWLDKLDVYCGDNIALRNAIR